MLRVLALYKKDLAQSVVQFETRPFTTIFLFLVPLKFIITFLFRWQFQVFIFL